MDLGLGGAAVVVSGGTKGMGRAAEWARIVNVSRRDPREHGLAGLVPVGGDGRVNSYMTGANVNVDAGSDFA